MPNTLTDWGEATGEIAGDCVQQEDGPVTRRVLSSSVLLPILRNAGSKVVGWRYGGCGGITYLKVFLDN